MKIYIDFDDVLCETAEYFTKIAKGQIGGTDCGRIRGESRDSCAYLHGCGKMCNHDRYRTRI